MRVKWAVYIFFLNIQELMFLFVWIWIRIVFAWIRIRIQVRPGSGSVTTFFRSGIGIRIKIIRIRNTSESRMLVGWLLVPARFRGHEAGQLCWGRAHRLRGPAQDWRDSWLHLSLPCRSAHISVLELSLLPGWNRRRSLGSALASKFWLNKTVAV